MIAFWDNLPLIEHVNGHVSAFERDWLTRSLARAAAKAGYAQWWLAEQVAPSVTEAARERGPERDGVSAAAARLERAAHRAAEPVGQGGAGEHRVRGRGAAFRAG